MERREIEQMRLILLAFLLLVIDHRLLGDTGLLLGFLVNAQLMPDLSDINIITTAFVLHLLSLFVSTEEKAYTANDDLFVLGETSLFHNFDGFGVGPDLTLPELSGQLDGPKSLGGGAIRSNQIEQDRLHGPVQLMVGRLGICRAKFRQNFLEQKGAQCLAGGGNEDRE